MPSIILIRHGQSQFNSSSKFCGWLDVQLSNKGESQASQAGQLIHSTLPDYKPDLLITSRLKRSCQTGYLITKELGCEYIDVERTWRLNERHYGSLQGRDKSEVLKEVGEEKYMFWRRDFKGVPPLLQSKYDGNSGIDERYDGEEAGLIPLGESLEMVIKRLTPYLDSVIEKLKQGRKPLIIAHGSTCRSILKVLKKISDDDIKSVNIPNAIPILLEFNEKSFEFEGFRYLDEEEAKKRAEAVAKEGFQ